MSWFYLCGRNFLFVEKFCNSPFLLLAPIFSASLSLNSGGRLPLTFLTFLSNFESFQKKSNKSAPFLRSRLFLAFDDHLRDQSGKLKSRGFFWIPTIPWLPVREPTQQGQTLRNLSSQILVAAPAGASISINSSELNIYWWKWFSSGHWMWNRSGRWAETGGMGVFIAPLISLPSWQRDTCPATPRISYVNPTKGKSFHSFLFVGIARTADILNFSNILDWVICLAVPPET